MKTTVSTLLGFITGVTFGGITVWYLTKERYSEIAQQEINDVKNAFAEREKELVKEREKKEEKQLITVERSSIEKKEDILDYAKRIREAGYSQTVVPSKDEVPPSSEPYVISPDEFGEKDDYVLITLTYFADDVLSDEYGVVVTDVEDLVGDALDHFGEYEEDSVYVRNDEKKCDYEILRDLQTYEDFSTTIPPVH